ncbi:MULTISPECIES: hypothetical protein [Brevibacillus]|uniref:hypothetical protein n=1 Tax=Brevibacillus TaxID=55080 RepID=UPI000D113646|nr:MULTISPECIES: hypothetical protein [Brevibacillus]MED1945842.1 hypothetical protein [Brevibacillus formosus]MED2001204.1 hypothetical protein [Brevibacillus formosus]MED2085257.1 hypothetical protein [Brevibacillus formosus]PSK11867.1 hypothetical protein C7R94_25385 [Brevibacillus sp. NRRL NRS-603]
MKQLLYVMEETNMVIAWLPVADTAKIEEHLKPEGNRLYIVDDVPQPEVSEGEMVYTYYDGTIFTYEIKPRIKTDAEKYEELMRDIDGHLANAATVASLREQLKITQDALDALLLK